MISFEFERRFVRDKVSAKEISELSNGDLIALQNIIVDDLNGIHPKKKTVLREIDQRIIGSIQDEIRQELQRRLIERS